MGMDSTFDGRRQAAGLRALQERTGRKPKHLAAALNRDTNTYRHYLWGNRALKGSHLPILAQAFGITEAELAEAIGWGGEPAEEPQAPEGWDLRRELHTASPDDPDAAERAYLWLQSRPYDVQQTAVYTLRLANGVDPLPDDAVMIPTQTIDRPDERNERTVS